MTDPSVARAEQVPLLAAAGADRRRDHRARPPDVPRLVPGQRITEAHVAWLAANCDRDAFFLDPIDPSERAIRVGLTGRGGIK